MIAFRCGVAADLAMPAVDRRSTWERRSTRPLLDPWRFAAASPPAGPAVDLDPSSATGPVARFPTLGVRLATACSPRRDDSAGAIDAGCADARGAVASTDCEAAAGGNGTGGLAPGATVPGTSKSGRWDSGRWDSGTLASGESTAGGNGGGVSGGRQVGSSSSSRAGNWGDAASGLASSSGWGSSGEGYSASRRWGSCDSGSGRSSSPARLAASSTDGGSSGTCVKSISPWPGVSSGECFSGGRLDISNSWGSRARRLLFATHQRAFGQPRGI